MRFVIDLDKINSIEQFHNILSKRLGFQSCYGKNLDAMFDELTNLDKETVLAFVNEDKLSDKMQVYFDKAKCVLMDARDENENLDIELA